MELLEDLHRQVKEELKDLEPNKQQEIMMFQKFGIMRPLLNEVEMAICAGMPIEQALFKEMY